MIRSVSVYPSDFGRERMAQEEVEGPAELVGGASAEGSGYSQEKLRQYEWSRMKYYYAVVECDSKGREEKCYIGLGNHCTMMYLWCRDCRTCL